ncbi:hypothetical protein EYZ11_012092 [Aspergillus tanneri]|uniref:Uncharacterized protein n=1 Tax=Aspergillus tanneri TaxID=1220188 RepID=A0A4S3J136_9EURO|nr:uncharacterized protein ATNIH1004_000917 [Aspergillus tanneri]KAA8652017.1 hypothetical protein ATNIH1004_000917 [Aspergillus tanneri]THC88459.1 hypothetical protein EYZ11_012092 [Aspergillus tanneri]
MRPSLTHLHTSFNPSDRIPDPTPPPTTTTPTSSSSPLRRFYRGRRPISDARSDRTTTTGTATTESPRSHSQSPLRLSMSSMFFRPAVLLRQRPSKVDLALSAEQTRADKDAIERQGLQLMEPRPVDPVAVLLDVVALGHESEPELESLGDRTSRLSQASSRWSQPRFVMGGIFEVMEGRA